MTNNEIVILLKSFNELKNSLYLSSNENLNEELIFELYSYISNCPYSEDYKIVIRPLYYSELLDNLSLIKLNYFLELNGFDDKRDMILKLFPMINYEKTSDNIVMNDKI